MKSSRKRFWLGWICLLAAQFPLAAALPFTIENADGEWKSIQPHRQVGGTIAVEAILFRIGEQKRYVVLRSFNRPPPPDSPTDFADEVRRLFAKNPELPKGGRDETNVGFPGHVNEFETETAAGIFRCSVFAFTEEKSAWAVLYLEPKDAKPTATPFGLLHRAAPPPQDVVGMSAYRVSEQPVTGFPISLEFSGDGSGRVASVAVAKVPPYSDTEREGVQVGDKIVSIDGRKSQDFPMGVSKNSPLGKVFLNREPGDRVTLELISSHSTKPRTVILQVPGSLAAHR